MPELALPPSRAEVLRSIADWLDAHPDANATQINFNAYPGIARVDDFSISSATQLAEAARAIRGRWTKDTKGDSGLYMLTQEILPGVTFELVAMRSNVCERVKTGETTVHEPDPDAVALLPRVERVVETFEWHCAPILGAAS